ncbi:MAG: hypothetical protein HOJ15_01410 [Candidatus Jacksonbacteria bacterium]|jgi:hypothetical protein|nr:hypothetical protein [Candidatus Jacksonbacteria bacterium]MBT6034129.1 hypothetical protein [Candidatus Jacksonbacteria bacterium]MBT6301067.1 hypothetical protein [Candidatus Jacksonbacteria bacterium]MBT6756924.1 hypothetical protein [Candidatus Jacksonbacteria bacterium]MBT6955433.1 hypothetical protein [Candidatus Jacksonbacteria bacterium]
MENQKLSHRRDVVLSIIWMVIALILMGAVMYIDQQYKILETLAQRLLVF